MKNDPRELHFTLPALLYYLPGLLIAVTAPISLYVSRLEAYIYTSPGSMWRVEIVFIAFFVSLAAILRAVTKGDHAASGLAATLIISGLMLASDVFTELAICIALAWGTTTLLTRRINFRQFEVAIILASIILFGYYSILYAGNVIGSAKWDRNESLAAPIWNEYPSNPAGGAPDIYYIILDGYGSETMLRDIHNIDNAQFIRDLEARGFVIPHESRANYPRTILSLASSLNMQYLDHVSNAMQDSPLWWTLQGTFTHNETTNYLKANGYSTVNTASNWDFTTLPNADHTFSPFAINLNKFEEYQIQQTNLSLFTSLNADAFSLPTYSAHRKVVLLALNSLGEIAKLPSPKFTFVHIVSPHPPIVFDAEGNEQTPNYPFTLSDARQWVYPPSSYRQGYEAQIKFVNKKILAAVDAIFANSATPPVIIIQGDHGPGIFIDYEKMEKTCLYERFSILNAYYLPGMATAEIPADISPVNTFRMIFNMYFSENLEMLPNRQYFSEQGKTYQFTDVTERISSACDLPQGWIQE